MLFRSSYTVENFNISDDGRWIGYQGISAERYERNITEERINGDLYLLEVATGDIERLTNNEEVGEQGPTFSPDSRFVAYVSDESGRAEVYVRPFPDASAAKWPVSNRGGQEPRWSTSGRELFYRSEAGELVAVRLAPGPEFAIAEEHVLFSTLDFLTAGMYHMYDVLPNDNGFLFVHAEGETNGRVVVVQNWRSAAEQQRDR